MGKTVKKAILPVAGFALGGPIGAAVGFMGNSAIKSSQNARREARADRDAHMAEVDSLRQKVAGEMSNVTNQLTQSKKKVALGMARAYGSRRSGGGFGGASLTQGPLTNRLG